MDKLPNKSGRSPTGRATAAEPKVSTLRDGIPSAASVPDKLISDLTALKSLNPADNLNDYDYLCETVEQAIGFIAGVVAAGGGRHGA